MLSILDVFVVSFHKRGVLGTGYARKQGVLGTGQDTKGGYLPPHIHVLDIYTLPKKS